MKKAAPMLLLLHGVFLVVLVLGGFAALQGQSSSRQPPATVANGQTAQFGWSLFTGGTPLRARMYLHPSDLPPEVVRCSNCHAVHDGPEVKRSTAPRLTPELLLHPARRRGGPASAYNASSFCNLLRKGTDPAYVMVDVEMPRYTVTDAECAALWSFLTESSPHDQPDRHDTH